MKIRELFLLTIVVLVSSCQTDKEERPPLFSLIDNEISRMDFENRLSYSKDFNVYKYRNYYNGGGVSVGDINNDGLLDIYMTSNMEDNQLYINKGDLKFENQTEKAGVAGSKAWSSGCTMIDINADGHLDIYVCNSGDIAGDNKENELFINNGDGTFSEQAKAYGLNDRGFSTHASFFDYDKDGDLDVYLLNNSFKAIGSFNLKLNQRDTRDELGGDKLLRNDNGVFVDVSEEAGIYGSVIGFGLGITVGDVNNDDWEDIFVSNDFFERDYLYINQQDGTFKENLINEIKSISGASMGADIGDINNDGNQDIFVTEMLPDDPQRIKSVTTFEDWNKYQASVKNGYHHQFTRNTLHLNNGNSTFSEIGRYAGVEASDWSWGALLFDMDNDGYKDLFIANGIYQDLTDQDYLKYVANEQVMRSIIEDEGVNYKKLIDIIPSNPIPNHFYINDGNAAFERLSAVDVDIPSFSNGSAYGDLDNDGDLDLVINNVNMPAMIYQNNANLSSNNYLNVVLKGGDKNLNAIGAKVILTSGDSLTITQEVQGARGFQSSSDTRLNFGLGITERVDLKIIWQEGQSQELKNVAVNQIVEIIKLDNFDTTGAVSNENKKIIKSIVETEILHIENNYSDFTRERLLYLMKSNESPALSKSDIDRDGSTDLVFTGSKGSNTQIIYNYGGDNEEVTEINYSIELREAEHTDIAIGDFNGDSLEDIYLTSGGADVSPFSPVLFDHLLINNGNGNFTLSKQKLPNENDNISSSCVEVSDVDNDGDLDLFVGERLKIGSYGEPGSGFLLINDGEGNFEDKTAELISAVKNIGMITDAKFADLNGDDQEDLVITGEFMTIHFFINDGGVFKEIKYAQRDDLYGWWNTLEMADIDGDGDIDIVAGNHGLNSRFRATKDDPLKLYYNDFDQNGTKEGLLCYSGSDNKDYPIHLRHDLLEQIRTIEKRIPDYASYKTQSMDDIFTPEELEKSKIYLANEMRSVVMINKGSQQFDVLYLPSAAQLSPVYAIHCEDLDGDGDQDIMLGGNQYNVRPEAGIYDASYGLIIENKGSLKFESLTAKESGLKIKGQIRDFLKVNNELLVARNDDTILSLILDK